MAEAAESLESLTDSVVTLNEGAADKMSVRDAASALAQLRWQKQKDESPAEQNDAARAAMAKAAEARSAQESSQEDNAAPPQEAHGEEVTATPDQPETAPIEMPRSWAKDKAELWAGLAPEVQEYILDQDSKRQSGIRQSQNETAEQRKAAEAERAQYEQARKQYEEALPILQQLLHDQQQGDFADIKTMADVEKLAREDWPRYALWDAQQKKVAAIQQEMRASQERSQQEFQKQWSKFAADEDAKFVERAPEMADETKAKKLSEAGLSLLKDLGFSQDDIARTWNGQASLSLRDHRVQLLIRDAIRYREAKAAIPKAAVKPVPRVQRPGAAPVKGEAQDIQLNNLEQQLERTGSWKDAAALLVARRSKG